MNLKSLLTGFTVAAALAVIVPRPAATTKAVPIQNLKIVGEKGNLQAMERFTSSSEEGRGYQGYNPYYRRYDGRPPYYYRRGGNEGRPPYYRGGNEGGGRRWGFNQQVSASATYPSPQMATGN